jgi:predicted MFS family arabinose efflux permease
MLRRIMRSVSYEDRLPAIQLPQTLRALKHRNFRIYWTSNTVSFVGSWMQTAAQAWLVYRLTGSALYLGIVGFAQYLPVLLFGLFGGALADRLSKRKLLLFTQSAFMLQALTLGILTSTGLVQVWQVIGLALFFGIVQAIDAPARQSIVMEMVGRDDLTNALALNSTSFNVARIVGSAIGGVLVATIGEADCFYINSISFLAIIGALWRIDLPSGADSQGSATVWDRIREGLQYARSNRIVLALLSLMIVSTVFGFSYTTLVPFFAGDVLQIGPSGYGLLLAGTGVGALSAGLLLASRPSSERRGRWLTLGNLLFPCMLLVLATSRVVSLSWLALVGVGFGLILQNVSVNASLQTIAPEGYRGRVMSLYAMTFQGVVPFGSLQAGTVANVYGAPMAVGIGGLLCLLSALVIYWRVPQIRRLQ